MSSGKTVFKGKKCNLQILKGFSQKLTELSMKVSFYKWIVIKIKYSDGCGLLAELTEFVRKLNP